MATMKTCSKNHVSCPVRSECFRSTSQIGRGINALHSTAIRTTKSTPSRQLARSFFA